MTSVTITNKTRLPQVFIHQLVIISIAFLNFYWGIRGLRPYIPQTDGVMFMLWIFIPDCPLYALLFAGFILNRKRITTYQPLVWIVTLSLIKFSLAAPNIFLVFPDHYHAPPILGIQLPNIYPFDYFHLFLLTQGIILAIFFLERSVRNFLIAFGWLLLNDIIDFVFLTFPFYYMAYTQIDSLLVLYMITNLMILVIGLFFTLNIPSYIKEIVELPKREITRVPILTSAVVEDGDF
jgi:uncharacterized membrane protein YpjA